MWHASRACRGTGRQVHAARGVYLARCQQVQPASGCTSLIQVGTHTSARPNAGRSMHSQVGEKVGDAALPREALFRERDRSDRRDTRPLTVCPAPAEPADKSCLIESFSGRWWVLHTRSRHEKRVADALYRRGINYYLPLVGTVRTYGRRIKRFSIPLFPGYVFLSGGQNALDVAWKTNRVARVLYVDNQDQIRTELRHIYRIVESGQPVDLYPALRRGRRCRIKWGPLRGIEGVVLRRRNAWRMYIAATVLGQSAVIEIDAVALEPID